MCTVTVIPTPDTVRLACNRDELRSRCQALPPRIQQVGPRRAILPIDPVSRGSWVAVNDAGLAMSVLNVNPADRRFANSVPPRSRGAILPSLLHCNTLASALAEASLLKPTDYAPFRLVLADDRELAELRSDGRDIRIVGPTVITEPFLFTSSGLGDHLVETPRRRLFAEFVRRPGDPIAWQDDFHRHHWSDRPHLSVCMRRDEARTVSHTIVTLRQDRVTLTYHPDAPDQPAVPISMHFDLQPRGA
jgi:hypothetical protein